jgi:hypothetical protein
MSGLWKNIQIYREGNRPGGELSGYRRIVMWRIVSVANRYINTIIPVSDRIVSLLLKKFSFLGLKNHSHNSEQHIEFKWTVKTLYFMLGPLILKKRRQWRCQIAVGDIIGEVEKCLRRCFSRWQYYKLWKFKLIYFSISFDIIFYFSTLMNFLCVIYWLKF